MLFRSPQNPKTPKPHTVDEKVRRIVNIDAKDHLGLAMPPGTQFYVYYYFCLPYIINARASGDALRFDVMRLLFFELSRLMSGSSCVLVAVIPLTILLSTYSLIPAPLAMLPA